VVLAIAGGGAWWWTHRTPKTEPAPQIAAQTNTQPAPQAPAEAPAAAPVPPVVPVDQALTNDNIIQMMEAKVSQAIILSQIRNSKTAFNLSAQEVIRLSKARVPENIIEAMRDPKAVPVKAAPPPASLAPAPVAPPAPVSASSSSPGPAAAPAPPESVPAVSATASRPAVAVTLSDGMAFSITLAEDIPQNAEEGRQIHFTVAKDVRAGDLVAITKGAPVTGEVAQAARKGTLGFGGSKAMLRLLVVDAVDGKKYRVRAQSARSADGKNERSVETNVKPKNKELAAEAGTEYIAYIDGDVTISVKK
jgi:hypothetical protein